MVVTKLDKSISDLLHSTDHKTAATWALDCAERVLPYFENKYPKDDRPRRAIEAGRAWASSGVFSMAVIRKASLDSHAAARDAAQDDAARSAARAAGQAMASAHVAGHATAAAVYGATAVRDAADPAVADAEVDKERDWQYKHLLQLTQREYAHYQ